MGHQLLHESGKKGILSRYRAPGKSMYFLLSRTQAGPGRTVKQEEEDISSNHVQTFSGCSVVACVIPRFGEIILELGRSLSKLGHCISALLHGRSKLCSWLFHLLHFPIICPAAQLVTGNKTMQGRRGLGWGKRRREKQD